MTPIYLHFGRFSWNDFQVRGREWTCINVYSLNASLLESLVCVCVRKPSWRSWWKCACVPSAVQPDGGRTSAHCRLFPPNEHTVMLHGALSVQTSLSKQCHPQRKCLDSSPLRAGWMFMKTWRVPLRQLWRAVGRRRRLINPQLVVNSAQALTKRQLIT